MGEYASNVDWRLKRVGEDSGEVAVLTVIGLAGLEGGEYRASCDDCCLWSLGETDRCDDV